MGEIMLNGRPYSAGVSYKELTQAEYNALPDSKYTDGIMYCIKDGTGGVEGFPPLIYSNEEREIGVWTDGKPLYCKTIATDHLTNSGNWQTLAHNISDIDKIICFYGKVYVTSDQAYWIIPSPRAGNTNGYSVFIDKTNIKYINNIHATNITADVSFTIYYTKTTDTAGSGQWTTQGEVAHHYSTTERVIGTWIDGKPIYEKTMHFPKSELTSKDMYINHNISNLDKIIDIRGAMRAENQNLIITGYQWGSEWGCSIGDVTSTTFYLRMGGGRYSAVTEVDIIFQYTKTTD